MPNTRSAGPSTSSEPASPQLCVAILQSIREDSQLLVMVPGIGLVVTAWLETASNLQVRLEVGDSLLVHLGPTIAIALGRVGSYVRQAAVLELESTQAMTLSCGKSSLQMRSDGRVLLGGEDVTVRANGTQRIRAGTVSIN